MPLRVRMTDYLILLSGVVVIKIERWAKVRLARILIRPLAKALERRYQFHQEALNTLQESVQLSIGPS